MKIVNSKNSKGILYKTVVFKFLLCENWAESRLSPLDESTIEIISEKIAHRPTINMTPCTYSSSAVFDEGFEYAMHTNLHLHLHFHNDI